MDEKLEVGAQVCMAQMLLQFQFFLQHLKDAKIETSNPTHGIFGKKGTVGTELAMAVQVICSTSQAWPSTINFLFSSPHSWQFMACSSAFSRMRIYRCHLPRWCHPHTCSPHCHHWVPTLHPLEEWQHLLLQEEEWVLVLQPVHPLPCHCWHLPSWRLCLAGRMLASLASSSSQYYDEAKQAYYKAEGQHHCGCR